MPPHFSFLRKCFQIFWFGSGFEHLFNDLFGSGGKSEEREARGVKPHSDTVGFDHASQSKAETTPALIQATVKHSGTQLLLCLLGCWMYSCRRLFKGKRTEIIQKLLHCATAQTLVAISGTYWLQ